MKKQSLLEFTALWLAGALTVPTALIAESAAAEALPEYTMIDLAEHDQQDSCWLAIEGKVYDITEFLPMHPTPPAIVLARCGREATEAMRTKGAVGREHAPVAWDMLEGYLIGVLADG
jgi:cytochrome b involved in lipid metabolism